MQQSPPYFLHKIMNKYKLINAVSFLYSLWMCVGICFRVTVFHSFDKDGNFSLLLETIRETDVNGICFEMCSITRSVYFLPRFFLK